MNEKEWLRGQLYELINKADEEILRILLAFTRALIK
jgi:hypothetical protein